MNCKCEGKLKLIKETFNDGIFYGLFRCQKCEKEYLCTSQSGDYIEEYMEDEFNEDDIFV